MSSKGLIAFKNVFWRFAERMGAQLVGFVVSIILARMIDPADYGSIALILVFIKILQVFVDSGLGNALIQKKDADNLDFSTVFYTNVCFCLLLYLLAYAAAPYVSEYYKDVSLVWPFRVLSLTILISGVKNVQQAYVSRNMQFKKFFFSTLGGTIFAAIVGIALAFRGYGIWALVIQQVSNLLIDTIILWCVVEWKPQKCFSFSRLRSLFSFGWKLLFSSLLDTIYKNIYSLVIGKMYTSADLAFYNRADQMPHLFVNNINASLDSVLFSSLSKEQNDIERVRSMTRRTIKTSTYFMAPLMMGMAFTAETIISTILTDKWLPCVPYLVIFCVVYMFYPIHTANLKAIVSLGRSDINLKLEIQKKIIGFAVLLITMWFGVMAIAGGMLVLCFASQIINSYPNKKLINYSYSAQLKDILPNILLALFMGGLVFPIKYLPLPNIIILIIQVLSGALIYWGGSIVTKNESYNYAKSILSDVIAQKTSQ